MKHLLPTFLIIAVATMVCDAYEAVAQDCSTAVSAALADGSLNVVSVAPEGVRIILQGDLANQTDPEQLRALVNNIECALAGPGGRLKKLELLSTSQQVLVRDRGGEIELPTQKTQ